VVDAPPQPPPDPVNKYVAVARSAAVGTELAPVVAKPYDYVTVW